MDTRIYAKSGCARCGGSGRVRTGVGINDWAVCACAIFGQRQEAAQMMLESSLPSKALSMTFATFDTGNDPQNAGAVTVARNFVDHWLEAAEAGWMVGFYGEPGSGKTHLAVAIGQSLARRFNVRPMLLNLPKALRQEKERFSNPELNSPFSAAQLAPFLILDDLGAEYESQAHDRSRVSWLTENLYALLDERVMQGRPTVYTTNLSPSDLKRRYEGSEAWQRVWSRIERAQVIRQPVQLVKVADVGEGARAGAEDMLLKPRP